MSTQVYTWNAVDYAKSSSIQQQWARELIYKLNLKGDEKLLDIGSGDGKVTAEIATHVLNGSVLGIDNSVEMIALAQNRYPRDTFPNLRFQRENANDLPFENEFDVIFSNATLHWILDHRPVLQGIFASLKQGGKVLLQMGGKGNASDVGDAFETLTMRNEWRDYFSGFRFPYGFYGVEEYRKWIQESGLHAERIELIPKDAIHKDRSAFEAWIRTTWLPHTQQVPEEKRDTFIAGFAETYLEHHPVDSNGRVHVKMVRLEVEARKY